MRCRSGIEKFRKFTPSPKPRVQKIPEKKIPEENPVSDTLSPKRRLDLLYEERRDLFLSITHADGAGFGAGREANADWIDDLQKRLDVVETEIESLEASLEGRLSPGISVWEYDG